MVETFKLEVSFQGHQFLAQLTPFKRVNKRSSRRFGRRPAVKYNKGVTVEPENIQLKSYHEPQLKRMLSQQKAHQFQTLL